MLLHPLCNPRCLFEGVPEVEEAGLFPVLLLHRPQAFLVPLGHVVEDRVAHVEDRLGRPVVLFELDDPAAGKLLGEPHDVLVRRAPETVDRLASTPTTRSCHAPPPVIGDVPLHGVRVLELVDHHVAVTVGQLVTDLFVPEEDLQVEEQVVVVEASRRDLVRHVLFPDLLDLFQILIEGRIILWQHLLDGHLLVEGHAEDLSEHVLPGRRLLLRIEAELDGAPLYRLFGVRLIVDGEGVGEPEEVAVPAEYLIRKGMKGAAVHALPGAPSGCDWLPSIYLLGASPREGEEDDGCGVDAGLHEVKDAKLDHPRFAASRAGDDEDRALGGSNGLVLPVVELSSYLFLHLFDRALD